MAPCSLEVHWCAPVPHPSRCCSCHLPWSKMRNVRPCRPCHCSDGRDEAVTDEAASKISGLDRRESNTRGGLRKIDLWFESKDGAHWRVPQIVLFTWRAGWTLPEAVMPGKSGSPLGGLSLSTRQFKSGLNGVRGQFF